MCHYEQVADAAFLKDAHDVVLAWDHSADSDIQRSLVLELLCKLELRGVLMLLGMRCTAGSVLIPPPKLRCLQ